MKLAFKFTVPKSPFSICLTLKISSLFTKAIYLKDSKYCNILLLCMSVALLVLAR